MENFITFHYACVCGKEGNRPIKAPVDVNMVYAASDCMRCGNVILITPNKVIDDEKYAYQVRICKPEAEMQHETR